MGLYAHIANALGIIWGNKLRSGLSMFGVVIGIMSVVVMMSIGEWVREDIKSSWSGNADKINITPDEGNGGMMWSQVGDQGQKAIRSGRQVLNDDTIDRIRRLIPNVKAVIPMTDVSVGMSLFDGKQIYPQITGANEYYLPAQKQELSQWRNFSLDDLQENAKVAIVTRPAIDSDYYMFSGNPQDRPPLGDVVGKKIFLWGKQFTIIGVIKEKGSWSQIDGMIFIPISTAKKVFWVNTFRQIDVQVKDITKMRETQKDVFYLLYQLSGVDDTSQIRFQVKTNEDILKEAEKMIAKMQLFLIGIGSISLFVGGIGIMTVMLMSVTERTREVGIRKAIGAGFGQILMQFLVEGSIMSFCGGLLGIAGSYGVVMLIQKLTTEVPMMLNQNTLALACMVSIWTGIVFSILPAWKAAKMKPIDALRFE